MTEKEMKRYRDQMISCVENMRSHRVEAKRLMEAQDYDGALRASIEVLRSSSHHDQLMIRFLEQLLADNFLIELNHPKGGMYM